jgi:hypothetical protein
VNTPVPGSTQAAEATADAASGGTPGASDGTPGTGPAGEDAPTPTQEEVAFANDPNIDPDQVGGNPSDPPRVVTDLPDPPSGAAIDPDTIAPPNATAAGVEFIIDANASEPGIQSARTVNVGDVIRVGVVLANVPAEGVSAFNFRLIYNTNALIAPTINGGSTLGRNPDMNEAALGGAAAGWLCMPPAPEGHADEPGLWEGDGDPATGEAVITCYAPVPTNATGTQVLAVVTFQAVGAGTSQLSLVETAAFDSSYSQVGACEGAPPVVTCGTAAVTVN